MAGITTESMKIPTTYLPDDWKEQGAAKFGCSENTIERVVYGVTPARKKNMKIFDFMLKMAEDGKEQFEKEEAERKQRLEALSAEKS